MSIIQKIWLSITLILSLASLSTHASTDPKSNSTTNINQSPNTPTPQAQKPWLEVDIGLIGAASVDILQSALAEANDQSYAGLLIRLDTPGGALDATRTMVKDILASPIPIIVWVGPSGAHAGSAGAFVTLAAHIATMAPGTQIGAAHPVMGNGQDLEQGSDMREKVENDTIAFMESIAQLRGRNVEMARSFVATSVSLSAEEALQNRVIDFIARDTNEVLRQVQDKELTVKEQKIKIQGSETVAFVKTWRQQLLEILSNPNLFYLLFTAGLLGLGFELTHPGALVPGVIGAISLILALISSSVLPVNLGAMLLIAASIAFMIAEVFLPSFGILGIGGFVGFVVGSVLLIDGRQQLGLDISWFSIVPASLVLLGLFFLISYMVMRNQKNPIKSGIEGLSGKHAEALEDFQSGQGQVRLEGEIWNAKSSVDLSILKGESLVVLAVEGLNLIVSPLPPAPKG